LRRFGLLSFFGNIAGIVCIVVVVLGGAVVVWIRSRSRQARSQVSRETIARVGLVPSAQPVDRRDAAAETEEPDASLSTLDCTSLVLPSPERPPTDVDAVFIDLIRQAEELPSALLELTRLLREGRADARRIAELVGTDPVLSVRVLRVANSAAYGRGKITSLQRSVMLLGFNQVWMLVNQMLASRSMRSIAKLDAADMMALWGHAAAASVCARHLITSTRYMGSPEAATVITCSLLHDIGKFLLCGLAHHGGGGQEAPAEASHMETVPLISENESYGVDHCRLGFLLSTYWKLPEEICTSIAYHHHPSFANREDVPQHVREIVTLVALSDYLAKVCGTLGLTKAAYRLPPESLSIIGLGMPPERMITNELRMELRRTAELIKNVSS
jgi:HD-like signal output (HDOD) protein